LACLKRLRGGGRSYFIPISPHCASQQGTSDGIIDRHVFQGVVDLNDTDSTDFSTQMVNTYLAVATSTLADMDRAVCVTHFTIISRSTFIFTFHPPSHPSILPWPAVSHLLFVRKSYVLYSNRWNKDVSKLSLLAVSLQDTSDAMGVTEVRQSCSRLREAIRLWNENQRKAGGVGASIDAIVALHGRLKGDFALAKSWLSRYVETGNVPLDDGSTRGAMMAGVVATSADPNSSW